MLSESARRLRGAFLISLLIGNEFVTMAKAHRDTGSLSKLQPKEDSLTSAENRPSMENNTALTLNAHGAMLLKVNATHDANAPNGKKCCCKAWNPSAPENAWWREGSCSHQGLGQLTNGNTLCCKERKGRCDSVLSMFARGRVSFAYSHERPPIPGCGIDGAPGLMRSRGGMRNLFDKSDLVQMTQVTGTWEKGWMLYFGLSNTGRSAIANTAVEIDAGVGEVLAETIGAGFAPVAITFGTIGLLTSERQVYKLKKYLNDELSTPQRQFLECQIINQRKNQAVTTFLLGVGIAAAAGAFTAGVMTVVAGAVAATVAIGNTVRNKMFACKAESAALAAWIQSEQESIHARMQEIDAAEVEVCDQLDDDTGNASSIECAVPVDSCPGNGETICLDLKDVNDDGMMDNAN